MSAEFIPDSQFEGNSISKKSVYYDQSGVLGSINNEETCNSNHNRLAGARFKKYRIFKYFTYASPFFLLILLYFSRQIYLQPQGLLQFEISPDRFQSLPQQRQSELQPSEPLSIAIIGAGAAGSSAAYYLQKYSNFGFNITIFDSNPYIGGRSTTAKIDGLDIELGASIFVDANKILMNAVSEFNLELTDLASDDSEEEFGIWNGEYFEWQETQSSIPFYSKLRFIQHFGYHSIKTVQEVKSKVLDNFLTNYYDTYFPFESLSSINTLIDYTSRTGAEFLEELKISNNLISFIQSLTRVNYAQELDQIHALGTIVTLCAEGAKSVKGGNHRLFEQWVNHSRSTVYLNTSVNSISRQGGKNAGYSLVFSESDSVIQRLLNFDKLIIAAPLNQTDITFNFKPSGDLQKLVDSPPEYVNLHVTLIRTSRKLSNSQYFKQPRGRKWHDNPLNPEKQNAPQQILTSNNSSNFYSISQVGYISEKSLYVYKIFSSGELSSQELFSMFGYWASILNKEWLSYPILSPGSVTGAYGVGFEVDEDIWYINSIEPFISTMETEALGGANVAALIARKSNKVMSPLTLP